MKCEKIGQMLKDMTIEEKAMILTGSVGMYTAEIERLDIKKRELADGPHGVRAQKERNCTHFSCLSSLASSWSIDTAKKMGISLGDECINANISMLLAPGMNIKRNILCGRNFEYFSEDPILCGEIGAAYVEGLQSKGIIATIKHFAVNSQENHRDYLNMEVDERTLREIYLRGFEIAVKKSKPKSVMCATNKVNGIWCSDNSFLLQQVLKDEWGFDGFVISDWGAVHDVGRSLKAGLDLQMPSNPSIVDQVKAGLEKEEITVSDLDRAVERILSVLLSQEFERNQYDREKQHKIARAIAADGIVLLKNEDKALPLTADKYKKIGIVGEFADKPLICGQGSAEVQQKEEYIDSPVEEIKKLIPNVKYKEFYKKGKYSDVMLWPTLGEFDDFAAECDAIVLFVGSMVSEETENFDRRSASLNPNYEMYIEKAAKLNKKVIVVLQTGSAIILGRWKDKVSAIVEMWLGGESAGGAIADVLCGVVNPSGKLSETFPKKLRKDIESFGSDLIVQFNEKLDVGYRYYDKHTDEICYPFGYGLSYTEFLYSDLKIECGEEVKVKCSIENIGDVDGAEVVELYISKINSGVTRPVKELKGFDKIFLKPGEKKEICFVVSDNDLAYYNVMLHDWVCENGEYEALVGASSQDIRLCGNFVKDSKMPFVTEKINEVTIGELNAVRG